MKKTITAAVGGRNFIFDEDAYDALKNYLDKFRIALKAPAAQADEIMEELEMRIGDLFKEELFGREVVDIKIVRKIVMQLGMPDGSEPSFGWSESHGSGWTGQTVSAPQKKLFRNPDDRIFGGVCSGLAVFFNIDTSIVRILFLIVLFLGSAGFWIYLAFWIVLPLARTPAEKCAMYGMSPTAENMNRFHNSI